jgi:hypothetical protein
MKRFTAILGTLLIAAVIIISGSTVATMVYAHHYVPGYSYNCTNPKEAEGPYDTDYASVGVTGPPPVLERLTLDMGPEENWIPPDTDFIVYGDISGTTETYTVTVWDGGHENYDYLGTGSDTNNETFTTADEETYNLMWRYIQIDATSGASDPTYGPEIDAVGWDK